MLANGYNGGADLTLAPDQFTDVKCPRFDAWEGGRYSNCFMDTEVESK